MKCRSCNLRHRYGQCCLSGFARVLIHFGRLEPYPDAHLEYGSGSRRANMTHKSEENSSFEMLHVFICLDVLYGGLGISEMQFLIKNLNCISAVNFSNFWSPKPWVWIRIQIRIRIPIDKKCWIRISIKTNADPQNW
jgi:hypothetical protein